MIYILIKFGGRGEIRTHGDITATTVFKTVALNHSATLPIKSFNLANEKLREFFSKYYNIVAILLVLMFLVRIFSSLYASTLLVS